MAFNRTAIFIDGSNLYATAKALHLDIDFKRLIDYFSQQEPVLRAYYYTAIIEDENEYISIKPLIDYLSYNGYSVVTKPAKQFTDPQTGLVKVKGNMDIELAVDAMELIPCINRMVLFSGDGDFCSLILAMQRKGVICDVVSTITTRPSLCADDLRRVADSFLDLSELGPHISRGREDKKQKASRYG